MKNKPRRGIIGKIISAREKYSFFSGDGEKVLVAVSGGADSVCLLHALHTLSEQFDIKIIAAHLNHGVRGAESDADEQFVRKLTTDIGTPLIVGKLDPCELETASGSLEADLREARYKFLFGAAARSGAEKIALGHTSDDQAETVLFRIIRGASPDGASGIKPVNGRLVRPILSASRTEVEEYCASNNLTYRTDSSNADIRYTRNRIRHKLIPLLESEFNPRVKKALSGFADMLVEDIELLDSLAGFSFADSILSRDAGSLILDSRALEDLPRPLLKRVLRNAALEVLAEDGGRLASIHVESMIAICTSGATGKTVEIPCGITAAKEYERLVLSKSAPDDTETCGDPRSFPITSTEGTFVIPEYGITLVLEAVAPSEDINTNTNMMIGYFDSDKLGAHMSVRCRKSGDLFHPLGAPGERKLSDFFIDSHIPRNVRGKTPLLISERGVIAWVVGYRISDDFKITDSTENVIKITAKRL